MCERAHVPYVVVLDWMAGDTNAPRRLSEKVRCYARAEIWERVRWDAVDVIRHRKSSSAPEEVVPFDDFLGYLRSNPRSGGVEDLEWVEERPGGLRCLDVRVSQSVLDHADAVRLGRFVQALNARGNRNQYRVTILADRGDAQGGRFWGRRSR